MFSIVDPVPMARIWLRILHAKPRLCRKNDMIVSLVNRSDDLNLVFLVFGLIKSSSTHRNQAVVYSGQRPSVQIETLGSSLCSTITTAKFVFIARRRASDVTTCFSLNNWKYGVDPPLVKLCHSIGSLSSINLVKTTDLILTTGRFWFFPSEVCQSKTLCLWIDFE